MTELWQASLASLGVLLAFLTLVWAASAYLKDASLVDRYWGSCFIVIALTVLMLSRDADTRAFVITGLVIVWGIRLSVYLTWRNWGQGEDYRYQAMRKRRPGFTMRSLVTVFWLQGALAWFVSLPVQAVIWIGGPSFPSIWDIAGIALWTIGMVFESVGDYQLARFKANPANEGKVLRTGLWQYTRHPNYFGDALLWWGLFIACCTVTPARYMVLSPIAMNLLLLKVSGVPLLEKRMKSRSGDYGDYVESTSAFIPRPPKHSASHRESGA